MEDSNLIVKCSLDNKTLEVLELFNETFNCSFSNTNGRIEEEASFLNIAGLVLILSIIMKLSIECSKMGDVIVKVKLYDTISEKTVLRIIMLTLLIVITPLLIIFLILAMVYKNLCFIVIQRKDKRFVKYLDSFDVFWSLEDDASKSIIHVLGVIESQSPQYLVENIKEKLKNISTNKTADKIFYRRNEDFGFYYWRKHSHIDMDQYVQMIDYPTKSERITIADLEELMTSVSSQTLPYLDKGLFQILVTKQCLNGDEKSQEYGIIFRIHHSVGDGVALIDFLCKTLADSDPAKSLNMFSSPSTINEKLPTNLLNMIRNLCEIPVCFVDGMLRKSDENSLHCPELIGTKVFKWTDDEENLLLKVKDIKESIDALRLSDILATSLSNGLRAYFAKTMASIPDDVAVVLPIRFPKSLIIDTGFTLENDFSVTILDLPTKSSNIIDIHTNCNEMRRSADPLTNYYFLKLVSRVLPNNILQPLLNSTKATIIFSNMPGPERLNICGSNPLKKLVFFVPNKGTTGVGVTALCYDGVLRFAAMADKALVSSSNDLALILNGMVEEINLLHSKYVRCYD